MPIVFLPTCVVGLITVREKRQIARGCQRIGWCDGYRTKMTKEGQHRLNALPTSKDLEGDLALMSIVRLGPHSYPGPRSSKDYFPFVLRANTTATTGNSSCLVVRPSYEWYDATSNDSSTIGLIARGKKSRHAREGGQQQENNAAGDAATLTLLGRRRMEKNQCIIVLSSPCGPCGRIDR
jgi:hypothetical protein